MHIKGLIIQNQNKMIDTILDSMKGQMEVSDEVILDHKQANVIIDLIEALQEYDQTVKKYETSGKNKLLTKGGQQLKEIRYSLYKVK